MAGWWRGLTLLLLVLCSVSLSAASDVDAFRGSNQESQDFSSRKLLYHRSLLQAPPPTPAQNPPVVPPPVATPPVATPPVATPPVATPPVATPPTRTPPVATPPARTPPTPAPLPPVRSPAPAPAPVLPPASPPTPVRTYLMWIGIGAFCLVIISVATFCLCRKFGQQKVRGAQRLPPLPRYH